jgi:hypothetical protein
LAVGKILLFLREPPHYPAPHTRTAPWCLTPRSSPCLTHCLRALAPTRHVPCAIRHSSNAQRTRRTQGEGRRKQKAAEAELPSPRKRLQLPALCLYSTSLRTQRSSTPQYFASSISVFVLLQFSNSTDLHFRTKSCQQQIFSSRQKHQIKVGFYNILPPNLLFKEAFCVKQGEWRGCNCPPLFHAGNKFIILAFMVWK